MAEIDFGNNFVARTVYICTYCINMLNDDPCGYCTKFAEKKLVRAHLFTNDRTRYLMTTF